MTSALHGYIYLDTALEVHPKSFSSVFLDGVTHLLRCVNPFPVLVQFVHEGATITGDGNLPLATLQCVRKLPMFGVNHLVSVCLFVRPRIVDIRRIAIEQRILVVIEANDFVRGTILNLHTHQPHCDVRQVFNRSEPTGHDSGHSSSARILTVRPSTKRGRLGKTCASLTRSCVEKSCTFNLVLHPDRILGHRLVKFLTCERSKSYFLDKLVFVVTEHAKEIGNFTVNIVVRLHG